MPCRGCLFLFAVIDMRKRVPAIIYVSGQGQESKTMGQNNINLSRSAVKMKAEKGGGQFSPTSFTRFLINLEVNNVRISSEERYTRAPLPGF